MADPSSPVTAGRVNWSHSRASGQVSMNQIGRPTTPTKIIPNPTAKIPRTVSCRSWSVLPTSTTGDSANGSRSISMAGSVGPGDPVRSLSEGSSGCVVTTGYAYLGTISRASPELPCSTRMRPPLLRVSWNHFSNARASRSVSDIFFLLLFARSFSS